LPVVFSGEGVPVLANGYSIIGFAS